MVLRPDEMGRFEFVVLATLRAHQLSRGCLSRIDGVHLRTVTAQLEVAGGHVVRLATPIGTDPTK
jgi:DNA-directed RNA polymerase subunit K/omega